MKHTKIMGRIALLFLTVMMMSFIPDSFHEFFGDWHCEGSQSIGHGLEHQHVGCIYGDVNDFDSHLPQWHWGFRHWMWMWMGVALFIYNTILIVSSIHKVNKEG